MTPVHVFISYERGLGGHGFLSDLFHPQKQRL